MTGVLVTVDDVGMARSVNAAVAALLDSGFRGCLSMMVTGRRFREAVDIVSGADTVFSVHLNCVEPPFLTDVEFPSSNTAWFLKGRTLAERVGKEWRAQIETALSVGLMITRLDSHRHLHHAPGLENVFLELAEEYGISSVRAAVLPDRNRNARAFLLNAMGRRLAGKAVKAGLSVMDAMLGFTASGAVNMDYLEGMRGRLDGLETVELVMHPSVEPVWSLHQPKELELMLSRRFRLWTGE